MRGGSVKNATPWTGPCPRSTTNPAVVGCPSFYPGMIRAFEEAMVALTNDTERKKEIQKLGSDDRNRIWITARLLGKNSTASFSYSSNNKRDLVKFKKNLETVCTPGRYFSSPEQFQQAFKILCSKWSVNIAHRHTTPSYMSLQKA